MKGVLKYPGAKWSLAPWIIGHFPRHHSYLEPFFGSGGVLFNKTRSNIETVNDLDGDVVNLFECIRSDPEKLAHFVYLTPYSRQVYNESYSQAPPDGKYEKAAQFLIRCNMGHGFRTSGGRVGWKNDVACRERAYAAKAWVDLPDTIMEAAERLRGVQIECVNAVDLIPRFNNPDVLIYCDPPYVLSTRHGKQYRHEMTDSDHYELLIALKRHQGPVLISGYANSLYGEELKDWYKQTATTTDQLSRVRTETLWMNFPPEQQITLF